MSLQTQAEMIRRITEEVMRRVDSPRGSASPDGAPCNSCGSPAQVAEAEGVCEIFSAPDAERTLENGFVSIGISARHCHLTAAQVELLFGKGAQLTPFKPLKQPGQFAAKEMISIIGPRGRAIERIRILGPCRSDTQVEVSLTDCVQLGVMAPVRASGDHRDTPGILIVGPKGHLAIERGVIRANRHIHLHTSEAAKLDLSDNATVMVKIDGDKPVIYYDVQVRVSEKFSAEMHLDTDDANAVGIQDGARAQIIRSPKDIAICGHFA